MSNRVKHIYEFGPFRLDLEQQTLLKEEKAVALPPRVFETLVLLIERRDRVTSKKEMMDVLWPDRYVEEANLSQNIFQLRKILGENHGKAKFIETVSKRGFRFVAPVNEIVEEIGPIIQPAEEQPVAEASALELKLSVPKVKEDTTTDVPQTVTLAVLPAINETNDPNLEYLSDGICDNIIINLSQLPQLRVISRSLVSGYKRQQVDPREAGRELGAETVLITKVSTGLIVTAELVEVSTGGQLWGQQYHCSLSDILQFQNELATTISERLKLKLTEEEKQRLRRHYTQNPEAYQAYLKGRYHWNKHTAAGYAKAIESYEEAIRLDPQYALAYSALADSYVTFDFYGVLPPLEIGPKAKAAAVNALLLDDTLAEAHLRVGVRQDDLRTRVVRGRT